MTFVNQEIPSTRLNIQIALEFLTTSLSLTSNRKIVVITLYR